MLKKYKNLYCITWEKKIYLTVSNTDEDLPGSYKVCYSVLIIQRFPYLVKYLETI